MAGPVVPTPSNLAARGAENAPVGLLAERFGGYRAERLLGRGGMGAVYEAEHLETGRRVALKVLSHSLDSSETRKRFLREGRLAASINHPNSVYIFGTEEIEGTPVISMELVTGGTLKELVQKDGPRPVTEAVDVILQVIAGLEAAQAAGVLHRDIKPGNCFVDGQGGVKIGDFGLSISTVSLDETNLTMAGSFLGTPAYCSPEQLRGDELDVRSDIYAVGVTLYYLLTGKTPFESENMVQLLATVLEKLPPSPGKLRPELPRGLVNLVLRCLEKDPGRRFKNYEELAKALAPYSSAAPMPATIGMRTMAGFLDMAVLGMVSASIYQVLGLSIMDTQAMLKNATLLRSIGSLAFVVLYYGLPEGLWGASCGKALCRLRVVGPSRTMAGIGRACLRALVFEGVPALPALALVMFGANEEYSAQGAGKIAFWLTGIGFFGLRGALFATARARNGFAALHDLLSGTRVTARQTFQSRARALAEEICPPASAAMGQLGPYAIVQTLGKSGSSEWLLAFDAPLQRQVWIHLPPTGSPPVAPQLRSLGRAGRLRWINGKRTDNECWDAYEALSGGPMLEVITEGPGWQKVRYWLLDLAEELVSGLKDGSTPPVLGLNRIWITGAGRAKLLDFPAPSTRPAAEGPPSLAEVNKPPPVPGTRERTLLKQVAAAGLEGEILTAEQARDWSVKKPLPLHARDFLDGLSSTTDFGRVPEQLKALVQRIGTLTGARRLGFLGLCFLTAAAFALWGALGAIIISQASQENAQPAMIAEGSRYLESYEASRTPLRPDQIEMRDALTVWIAGTYPEAISPKKGPGEMFKAAAISERRKKLVEGVVASRPPPTRDELAAATRRLKDFINDHKPQPLRLDTHFVEGLLRTTVALWLGFFVIPALVAALLFRGGLLLSMAQIGIVTANGTPASRGRVFCRTLVSSLPIVLVMFLSGLLNPFHVRAPDSVRICLLIFYVGAAVWSLRDPQRGLPDRIAGTWLVPK